MSKSRKLEAAQASNVFQFNLAGLIIFSLALISGAAATAYKLADKPRHSLSETFAVDPNDKSRSVHSGPWGDLVTRDIELERPAEFLNEEVSNPQTETWMFKGLKPEGVKALLMKDGLTAGQVTGLFAPGTVTEDKSGTRLTPPAEALLALDSATRGKLYMALAGLEVNLYLDYPYIFPGDNLNSVYASPRLNADDVAWLKQLVYANGNAWQMSDYQLLLRKIPTLERRVAMAKALSRQHAVFAGLAIKPDTDIDKIATYWSNVPNVRFTDMRPLLESLKALPEGGNLSLFYMLPKFARDRLYTYPLPPHAGDPVLDCHWTTFNFSNDTPDNRFNDPNFAIQYITQNYYQIAAPSLYGDVLLLMNDKNEIKHSAMYLADDLVFTKNGNNYRQPWMIMHIPDLLATYPATPTMHAVYIRNKVD